MLQIVTVSILGFLYPHTAEYLGKEHFTVEQQKNELNGHGW